LTGNEWKEGCYRKREGKLKLKCRKTKEGLKRKG
jgi:hypothetical protein